MKNRIWILPAALAVLLVVFRSGPRKEDEPALPAKAASPSVRPISSRPDRIETPAEESAPAPALSGELRKQPPHPEAVHFGEGHLSPAVELEQLHGFFELYRQRFGAFPAGEDNARFMNALRGDNPGRLGIFPLQHPRLNGRGELLDALGRPYFFHAISRNDLEIRSYGPDGEPYSGDDLLVPGPRPSGH